MPAHKYHKKPRLHSSGVNAIGRADPQIGPLCNSSASKGLNSLDIAPWKENTDLAKTKVEDYFPLLQRNMSP